MCINPDFYQPSDRSTYYKRAWAEIIKHCHDYSCAFCGSDQDLQCHHRDQDITNNHISNLLILCADCHQMMHPEISVYPKGKSRIEIERKEKEKKKCVVPINPVVCVYDRD